jgi:hypothetical protein
MEPAREFCDECACECLSLLFRIEPVKEGAMPDQPADPIHYDMKIPPDPKHRDEESEPAKKQGDKIDTGSSDKDAHPEEQKKP